MPRNPHLTAFLQAMLVVIIWSSSWVFIKIGLDDNAIPPVTFAGLRYTLAFSLLLALNLSRRAQRTAIRRLSRRGWLRLAMLGLIGYAAAQGAQFMALAVLPALTTNLILSLTAIVVVWMGMGMLREIPAPVQWAGIALYFVGVFVFFGRHALVGGEIAGLMWALLSVIASALWAVMGRGINRVRDLDPLTITVVSMGIGALVMLAVGVATQGLPPLSVQAWLIIGWLAVVNTAFTFVLWNHTLRTLSALESSLVNSLALVFIPLFVWIFLKEQITTQQGIGMVLATCGILAVQLQRTRQAPVPSIPPAVIETEL